MKKCTSAFNIHAVVPAFAISSAASLFVVLILLYSLHLQLSFYVDGAVLFSLHALHLQLRLIAVMRCMQCAANRANIVSALLLACWPFQYWALQEQARVFRHRIGSD